MSAHCLNVSLAGVNNEVNEACCALPKSGFPSHLNIFAVAAAVLGTTAESVSSVSIALNVSSQTLVFCAF